MSFSDGWLMKIWYTHTMEYYSASWKCEIMKYMEVYTKCINSAPKRQMFSVICDN